MRVLAVSDMHGSLSHVMSALDKTRPDLLISCGDWGDPGSVASEDIAQIAARTRVYTVYGNHDDLSLLRSVQNSDGTPILLESGRVYRTGGIAIGGINGIWATSNEKACYTTDAEVMKSARLLADQRLDIFVSHGCAVGLADRVPGGRHGGKRSWLDAYKIIYPRLYLCGHLHAAQVKTVGSRNLVVNVGCTAVGDYWVFDIEGNDISYMQGNSSR